MKPIRLTKHAHQQCLERGTSAEEIAHAIQHGVKEPAKKNRCLYRYNFAFGQLWQDKFYAIKQVAPVVMDEDLEQVIITVYTFYF